VLPFARLLLGITAVIWLLTSHGTGPALGQNAGGTPVALVAADSEVVAVSVSAGTVLRRVHLPDPAVIAADPSGDAVVINQAGTVTFLDPRTLEVLTVLRGFRSPQCAAITPDGEWVYVTDSATGELSVIELANRRVVDRVHVGVGAHSLAVSPDFHQAWVTIGETARTIVMLDTETANRPHVVDRIHVGLAASDLAFAPDGRTVWVGSASARSISVLDARSGRPVATVPAGPGPQHIAFNSDVHPRAFITSSGAWLEAVDASTRKLLKRVPVPDGSFNLSTAGGLVVTSSLGNGFVTEFTSTLRRLLTVTVARHARDVAITVW
jgi:YVTN family beta-propeller protein